MGAAAAPVAAVSSLASAGFGLAGAFTRADADIMRGRATQAQDEYQASNLDEAAKMGRLQAGLTDVTMREQLTTTLKNIEAIRVSDNVDPSSPTTGAIEDRNRMISDRQRMAAVVTQRTQADYDEASASYLRQSGQYAMAIAHNAANADRLAGFAQFAGGLGRMASSMS